MGAPDLLARGDVDDPQRGVFTSAQRHADRQPPAVGRDAEIFDRRALTVLVVLGRIEKQPLFAADALAKIELEDEVFRRALEIHKQLSRRLHVAHARVGVDQLHQARAQRLRDPATHRECVARNRSAHETMR
jgi:hypothetical protein